MNFTKQKKVYSSHSLDRSSKMLKAERHPALSDIFFFSSIMKATGKVCGTLDGPDSGSEREKMKS